MTSDTPTNICPSAEEFALAIAMGSHPRLGEESLLYVLDDAVLTLVISYCPLSLMAAIKCPEHFRDVRDAIKSAKDGATILLHRGFEWECETPLVIDKVLHIASLPDEMESSLDVPESHRARLRGDLTLISAGNGSTGTISNLILLPSSRDEAFVKNHSGDLHHCSQVTLRQRCFFPGSVSVSMCFSAYFSPCCNTDASA
jgi:hypothetical protein